MEKGSAVYGLGSLYLQFYITQLLLLFNDAYRTKGTHAFDQVFERYLHYQTIRLVKSAWLYQVFLVIHLKDGRLWNHC